MQKVSDVRKSNKRNNDQQQRTPERHLSLSTEQRATADTCNKPYNTGQVNQFQMIMT